MPSSWLLFRPVNSSHRLFDKSAKFVGTRLPNENRYDIGCDAVTRFAFTQRLFGVRARCRCDC